MSQFSFKRQLNKKLRGPQKLRWYCQPCHKQCRDQNGFQLHCKSPFHLKTLEKLTKDDLVSYNETFEKDFLQLLHRQHGEKLVEANKFYNDFIRDPEHVHMNATRFKSLTQFIKYLAQEGKVRVPETQDLSEVDELSHCMIQYVDRSNTNTQLQQELQTLETNAKDEQEVKHMLLQKQMEQYQKETDTDTDTNTQQQTNLETTLHTDTMLPMKITLRAAQRKKSTAKKSRKNLFK